MQAGERLTESGAIRIRPASMRDLDDSGQSVLEFVFMLPILIGLVVVMVRTNAVIQMSVVNQKYARAQALWLTFNSPYYPRLSFRKAGSPDDQFVQYGFNRMVIGMAEKPVDETGGKAVASVQAVTRDGKSTLDDGPSQTEPLDRASVRVRTTVALCTQANVIMTPEGPKPATADNIGEQTTYDYCRGTDE
jgi:hypothetical protein